MIDRRAALHLLALAATAAAVRPALAEPGRSDAAMAKDWPWLGRYADANRALIASGARVDTVFIGDSITQGWAEQRPDFFARPIRGGLLVDRGISGQTSPQIALRIVADAVALRPRRVHILAGTNDVAGNTGPMTIEATRDNIAMMIDVLKANRIEPIVGAIPPAAAFPWQPGARPASRIVAANLLLADLARQQRIRLVDYHRALLDPATLGIRAGLSGDGVHPNPAGYAIMERTLGIASAT